MKLGETLKKYIDVDRLFSRELREKGGEELRKARLAVYFATALLAQCAIYIGTYAFGGYPSLAAYIGFGAVLLLAVPLLLRTRSGVVAAGVHLGAVTVFVLGGVAYFTGGLFSTSIWWTCMVPVLTMLVSGKRAALLMAAVQVLVVGVFYQATESGFRFPTDLDPRAHPDLTLTDVVMLTATLFALAWLYERAKERMLNELSARNEEMRLVLDNVGQGFLCCTAAGVLLGKRSAIVERWFGPAPAGSTVWSYLGQRDSRFGSWLELGWSSLTEGFLPVEVSVGQLPTRFTCGARSFEVEYKPVESDGILSLVVLVVTDITAILESERAEAAQREVAETLDRAIRDRSGFRQFVEEVDELVATLAPASTTLKRTIHTIKGTCGLFGLRSMADACHLIEDRMAETGQPPSAASLEELRTNWTNFSERMATILGKGSGGIEIGEVDYDALRRAVQSMVNHAVLERMVAELRYEPIAASFERVAEQARRLAEKLGKAEPTVQIDASGIRLDPRRWRAFWAAFVHAVRNAVDHGIESPEDRLESGKVEAGRLRLRAEIANHELVIAIEDDGRGVDWPKVEARARSAGLPHETQDDLVQALFHEGLSTRDQASDVSGRGVGMGALKSAILALGGNIEITSVPGQGTILSLRFPEMARQSLPPGVAVANDAHAA